MRFLPDETELTPGSGAMWRIWNSGDYWGARRPVTRATIQKVQAYNFDLPNGRYKTLLFEQVNRPVELPNVKSASIQRGTDTDAATLTLELWNVAPLPYGVAPDAGHFERPGWYTPNRGALGNPWGDEANEWEDLLVENRVIRTYQGYGVDADAHADEDANLIKTGTWMIDVVVIRGDRTIVITCRDLGKVLIEQIAFPPIIPTLNYPIGFHARSASQELRGTTLLATTEGSTPIVAGLSHGNFVLDVQIGAGKGRIKWYDDYTDIVRYLCALAGLYWPIGGFLATELSSVTPVPVEDDVMLGDGNAYGDFQLCGTSGVVDLKAEVFDKRPLMDGIATVRDMLGFLFMIDEEGAAQWRLPNTWLVRNAVRPPPGEGVVRYTAFLPEISAERQLTDITITLSDRNGRSDVLVANSAGTVGASVAGREPHGIGLDRFAIYTDQHFGTASECRIMADLIAMRYVWSYRTATVTIPGCPMLQPDDQVRIFDRDTGEFYVHYINSISTRYDAETGQYTATLDTHWLGTDPGNWINDIAEVSEETQGYLGALKALVDVAVANQEAP